MSILTIRQASGSRLRPLVYTLLLFAAASIVEVGASESACEPQLVTQVP
jgi:hypothetical protein